MSVSPYDRWYHRCAPGQWPARKGSDFHAATRMGVPVSTTFSECSDLMRGGERSSQSPTSWCCDDRLNPPNTSVFDTASGWLRPGSRRRSAALATATTMLSPRPSTAFTRPKSFIDVGLGVRLKLSSLRHRNGSTGSITGGFSSRSATSRQPKPKNATMPCWTSQLWSHNLK